MTVNQNSLANLALGPKAKKKPSNRKRSSLTLSSCHWALLEVLGDGTKNEGAELLTEMVQLLQESYGHVPDDIADRIEALGIIKACEQMPDEYVVRNDKSEITAWIV